MERTVSESGDNGQEEQTMMMKMEEDEQPKVEDVEDEVYGEDGMMTLDSAVQEAVSQAAADQAEKQGEQLVAQIVHADPPVPGSKFFNFSTKLEIKWHKIIKKISTGRTRSVVLLLPDGQMIQTEMDEAQYQALDFDK